MDIKLFWLTTLIVATFLGFAGYVFFSGSFSVVTRASNENRIISPQTSLVFAWPLSLPADDTTTSEVTVFIRNPEGTGLPEEPVAVITDIGTVSPATGLTDADGKAVFQIKSAESGTATIEARSGSTRLTRTVTVQFQ